MAVIQTLVFVLSLYLGITKEFSLTFVYISILLMLLNFGVNFIKMKEFTNPQLTATENTNIMNSELFWDFIIYMGCVSLLSLLLFINPSYVVVMSLVISGLAIRVLKIYSIPVLLVVYGLYHIPYFGDSDIVAFGYIGYWSFLLYFLVISYSNLIGLKDILELMGLGKYRLWLTSMYLPQKKDSIKDVVSEMDTIDGITPSSELVNRNYKIKLNMDETYFYLKGLEKEMVNIYNEKVISTHENARKVHNNQDILKSINDFEHGRILSLGYKNKWKHATLKKVLKEHGYHHEAYENKVNTILNPYYNFVNSILIDSQTNTLTRDLAIATAGFVGEKNLMKELSLYNDIFDIDHSVRIEYNGDSVESDVIIYSKKGIFTVEAKNYSSSGSYSLHISKDGQWRKVYKNGKSEASSDVISQATRHVVIKQKLVNEELQKRGLTTKEQYITLDSMIVIVNDVVQITNETDYPILRISQIYNYIQKLPDIYTQEEVDNIKGIFDEYKLSGKKYPTEDYAREFSEWLDLVLPIYDLSYSLQPIMEDALLN